MGYTDKGAKSDHNRHTQVMGYIDRLQEYEENIQAEGGATWTDKTCTFWT